MSTSQGSAVPPSVERMHLEGIRVAERIDPIICGILADLARAKGLELKEPVLGLIHREHPIGNHCYAVWQMLRDRGRFMVKIELNSDPAFDHCYLKAMFQSRFWDNEAQRAGEMLCRVTGLQVDVERTQGDGIITYSSTMNP